MLVIWAVGSLGMELWGRSHEPTGKRLAPYTVPVMALGVPGPDYPQVSRIPGLDLQGNQDSGPYPKMKGVWSILLVGF